MVKSFGTSLPLNRNENYTNNKISKTKEIQQNDDQKHDLHIVLIIVVRFTNTPKCIGNFFTALALSEELHMAGEPR